MFVKNNFVTKQPLLNYNMSYFLQCRASWSSGQPDQEIQFEEFFPGNERSVQVDLFPDCHTAICFEFIPNDPAATTACVLGVTTNQKKIYYQKGRHYFAVKIPPHYFLEETKENKTFYRDKVCRLENFHPIFANFPYQKISQGNFESRIGLFQTFVHNQLLLTQHQLINQVLAYSLKNDSPMTLKELSDELHYSHRHIRRIFSEKIGVSPKPLFQTIRFHQLLDHLLTSSRKTAFLDFSDSFYDQSHFNRFFKSLTSYSPSELSRLLQQ